MSWPVHRSREWLDDIQETSQPVWKNSAVLSWELHAYVNDAAPLCQDDQFLGNRKTGLPALLKYILSLSKVDKKKRVSLKNKYKTQ